MGEKAGAEMNWCREDGTCQKRSRRERLPKFISYHKTTEQQTESPSEQGDDNVNMERITEKPQTRPIRLPKASHKTLHCSHPSSD